MKRTIRTPDEQAYFAEGPFRDKKGIKALKKMLKLYESLPKPQLEKLPTPLDWSDDKFD